METQQTTETTPVVMTAKQLFDHWQGHRGLTRKLIEAYPEDQLFTYSIGGMRTFADLLLEIIDLTEGGVEGIVTGQWKTMDQLLHVTGNGPKTKTAMLQLWDEVTEKMNKFSPQITEDRFADEILAFGSFPGTVCSTLLYFIDNEVHHRGQAYVYLRSLGVTPPPFWER